MATKLSILAYFSVFLSTLSLTSASTKGGFSVDFIHHDSPLSPFYNPNLNHFERVQKSIERSINRVNVLENSLLAASRDENGSITSDVISYSGEYLMKFGLGKPKVDILAIADTGSDITWTQCLPCENCYEQDAPLFNPKKSSTYKDFSCSSKACSALGQSGSCRSTCQYEIGYGDQSRTTGDLAAETVTFDSTSGRPISFPNIAIGCGHDNAGTFSAGSSGLVGLGRGPLSFISQLSSAIDGKFSYCLINPTSESENQTSKLNFGSQADISDDGVLSTPLISKVSISGRPSPFYYLTLESISLGNDDERILVKSSKSSPEQARGGYVERGNIIIDSGTTLTILPTETYEAFESKVRSAIDAEPVTGPSGLNLCYNIQELKTVPTITAHFTDADIVLKPYNTFIQVEEGTVCLAFSKSEDFSIFGNVAQRNFLVEYDIEGKKVNFLPTDCTKN